MGIEALTITDQGLSVEPRTHQDWQDWVSASDTRNYCLQDPILDWLDMYGEAKGFKRDNDLPSYDSRTDFTQFIFKKGREFEQAVIRWLQGLVPITTICTNAKSVRERGKAEETFHAMQSGAPVIYQGVLWDANSRTYGVPDLLVRADKLLELFPSAISPEEVAHRALGLGDVAWQYRVVDIKFTTLDLLADGGLGNGNSSPAYKCAVFIYNRALGRIQGYLPSSAYLLGRGWKQTLKGVEQRGNNCSARLAPIFFTNGSKKSKPLAATVDEAVDWVRRVRGEGVNWQVLPDPTISELRPNMKNPSHAPWSSAKKRIAEELDDLTLLWQVGVEKRRSANAAGVYCWQHSNCTAISVGVTGKTTGPILQAILDINRSSGIPIAPARITIDSSWRETSALEFYVDFETVSDLNDDFGQIPTRGGQQLIFMIGCGHIENGKWLFECFCAETLSEPCEAEIIESWLNHMSEVRDRLAPGRQPRVIHWSPAETSSLQNAYNAAVTRHGERGKAWPCPMWFDFLNKVIKAQPVVVRGAFGFGLKAFAKAMQRLGLIETKWQDGPDDGLGAMVGAWWCAAEAPQLGVRLIDVPLMKRIQHYNETDCKVMMEIIKYLRSNH